MNCHGTLRVFRMVADRNTLCPTWTNWTVDGPWLTISAPGSVGVAMGVGDDTGVGTADGVAWGVGEGVGAKAAAISTWGAVGSWSSRFCAVAGALSHTENWTL